MSVPALVYQPLVPGAEQILSSTPNEPPGGTDGYIDYYNGSTWVKKPVKYFNGSTWEIKPVKYYNGSTWVTI